MLRTDGKLSIKKKTKRSTKQTPLLTDVEAGGTDSASSAGPSRR